MIRIIIIAVALVLAVTGVALAWTGSRDADPGTSIELPDARHEDTDVGLDANDDETDDPDDDSLTGSVGLDSTESLGDNDDLSVASRDASVPASIDSYSDDRSTFKAAPTRTSIIKSSPTTTDIKKAPTPVQQQYYDDSVSQYSYDSVSVNSSSSDSL